MHSGKSSFGCKIRGGNIGYKLSAIGYHLSAISYQLSAIGYHLSAEERKHISLKDESRFPALTEEEKEVIIIITNTLDFSAHLRRYFVG